MKKLMMIAVSLLFIGCTDTMPNPNELVNITHYYTDYSITKLGDLCKNIDEGQHYRLDDNNGGALIKYENLCYIRVQSVVN